MRRFYQQVLSVWQGLSWIQRIVFSSLALISTGMVLGLGWWLAQPEYRVLFSELSAEDAAAITGKLQSKSVSYKLAAGGTAILVPSDKVQQLRLEMMAEGLPSRGGKGFEVLDESPLGLSPFLQHVNYTRALQVEIARTIMQLEPIAFARVHLSRPEPTPFVREQKPPTASVMLKLKPGATLNRSTAAGIVALVARSVEGLSPDQVTLVDSQGRVLFESRAEEGTAAMATQLDYQRDLENYLASKAEAMLAQVLGPGRAIVRVTAEINFKKTREKRETYSPEDRVVTSEKVTSSKSNQSAPVARGPAGTTSNLGRPGGAPAPSPTQNSQEETVETAYAVSKSIQELEDAVGTIERLSIAALVDLAAPGEDKKPVIPPQEVEEIVKQAVGFKTGRDQIKVTQVKLEPNAAWQGLDQQVLEVQKWQHYALLARQVSLGIVALVVFLLAVLILRRLRPTRATPTEPQENVSQVVAAAERDPEAVAQLIKLWLAQETSERKAAA
ncbi:MAG: flagellar M-ring protein FliF [Gemmataceae bacterium]